MTKTAELLDKAERKCKQYGIENPFGWGFLRNILGEKIYNPIEIAHFAKCNISNEDFFLMYENGHLDLITAILSVGVEPKTFKEISKILMQQKTLGNEGHQYLQEIDRKLKDYVEKVRRIWQNQHDRIKQLEYTKAFYLSFDEAKGLKKYVNRCRNGIVLGTTIMRKLKSVRPQPYYFSYEEIKEMREILKSFIKERDFDEVPKHIAKNLLKILKP